MMNIMGERLEAGLSEKIDKVTLTSGRMIPFKRRSMMSIHKQFLKSRPMCKVTFKIPETIGNGSENAYVVGEFNHWSTSATPMKRLKTGAFNVTVDLEVNRDYQFRYLLGESRWENDPDSDDFLPTPFGDSHNSVISL